MDHETFNRLFRMDAKDVVDLQGQLQELVVAKQASDAQQQELTDTTAYLQARADLIPTRTEKDYVAGSRGS